MNLFDYLDRRHRRKVILGQLKYWLKERDLNTASFHVIPERLMETHLKSCAFTDRKVKIYEDKLNELL